MPDINDIKKVSQRTDKWLKERQAKHITMVENSIKSLQDSIIDSLSILEVKKGQVQGVKVNLKQAQKIHKKIEIFFDQEFNKETKKIIDDFKETTSLIETNYGLLDESVKFTSIDITTMNILRDGYYQDYLSIGALKKDNVIQSIYNQVIGGGRFSDLVNIIEANLLGTDARGITGRPLAQYARLYAKDFIMNFHNEVNIKKAQDLDINHFLYLGNIIAKSRDFCKRRVGKTYTKDQINSWTYRWKGKSGPAFTHRGGYNCRHHWQPVRKEWLEDKKVNVQNWFKDNYK